MLLLLFSQFAAFLPEGESLQGRQGSGNLMVFSIIAFLALSLLSVYAHAGIIPRPVMAQNTLILNGVSDEALLKDVLKNQNQELFPLENVSEIFSRQSPVSKPKPVEVAVRPAPILPSYASGIISKLLQPVSKYKITSRFGMRHGRFHQGLDFAAPTGTPIYAPQDGVVVEVGWEGAYGKRILIDHGNGLKTRYGHCSRFLVNEGQQIRAGELIAEIGNTGRSTGPHLHFEVLAHEVPQNPEKYLTR